MLEGGYAVYKYQDSGVGTYSLVKLGRQDKMISVMMISVMIIYLTTKIIRETWYRNVLPPSINGINSNKLASSKMRKLKS